ncbi:MAG TPA: hypothetical protein VGC13_22325 [Longimicrobium sp.]|uniref:hypothetical protein n=1 Tax=Longimicrobium sp. TaxID=2029185 RepID=UPI002ED80C45
MTRQEERFRASVREELERRRAGLDDAPGRVLALLRLMQADILDVLAGAPSEFDAAFLPRLLSEVVRGVEHWSDRVVDAADGVWAGAARRGPRLLLMPLAAAGIHVGHGGGRLTDTLLRTVAGYSAEKLEIGLAQGRAAIEQHVRLAVLGGQSPHEAMQGIGRSLDGPGPFRRISHRSEVIVRTEVGRIHSAAADLRLMEAAELVPDLGKEWLWSGKSRVAHAAVSGQRRKAGEAFDVAGEKLQYPRDPAGSPENTILCGCESIPWMARWDS